VHPNGVGPIARLVAEDRAPQAYGGRAGAPRTELNVAGGPRVRILYLQSGYWLVGIVDWPKTGRLPGVARESWVLSTSRGTCPRAGRPRRSPVGGCVRAQYRDDVVGRPEVRDARGGLSVAAEIEMVCGIDWASQSHQFAGRCPGECLRRGRLDGGTGIEELFVCRFLVDCQPGATPEVIGDGHRNDAGPVSKLVGARFCVYGINPSKLDRVVTVSRGRRPKSCPSRKRGTKTRAPSRLWAGSIRGSTRAPVTRAKPEFTSSTQQRRP